MKLRKFPTLTFRQRKINRVVDEYNKALPHRKPYWLNAYNHLMAQEQKERTAKSEVMTIGRAILEVWLHILKKFG